MKQICIHIHGSLVRYQPNNVAYEISQRSAVVQLPSAVCDKFTSLTGKNLAEHIQSNIIAETCTLPQSTSIRLQTVRISYFRYSWRLDFWRIVFIWYFVSTYSACTCIGYIFYVGLITPHSSFIVYEIAIAICSSSKDVVTAVRCKWCVDAAFISISCHRWRHDIRWQQGQVVVWCQFRRDCCRW